jgi:hypothetical protein
MNTVPEGPEIIRPDDPPALVEVLSVLKQAYALDPGDSPLWDTFLAACARCTGVEAKS